MKRKLLILSVLAICVAIVAAGTLAYFTAEDTAHNVITSGGVDIELKEWADEAKQTPFEDVTGIMPGVTVTKIAEIKNTGASEAWGPRAHHEGHPARGRRRSRPRPDKARPEHDGLDAWHGRVLLL